MSSMRSASSRIKYSTCERSTPLFCRWAIMRPGVAITTSAPFSMPFLLDVPALAVATAVDHRRREGRIVGEALELLVDLLRQLARRHDDQRFHHIVGVALDEQFVQQRQRIGRGLSRTGLGAADNVAALQNHRNRVLLHGSHLVEIHILKTVEDFILQVEFIETHKTEIFNS